MFGINLLWKIIKFFTILYRYLQKKEVRKYGLEKDYGREITSKY